MSGYTVYKHTSPSGKVYIGITGRKPKDRWNSGYKNCPHFWNAIQKYGWGPIKHEIIAEGLTKEDAENLEIALIAEYHSTDRRYGYNADKGGSCQGRMSAETRKKLAAHMLGDLNPTRRFGHPFKGKHHSAESRKKMSEAAKARTGRVVTEATKQKLRESENKRSVICVETGVVYEGIHIAAEATGLSATKICSVCRGKRKKTGGLHWCYADKGQRAAIDALRLEILKEG